ncbi:unnamed protein product [Phytophthora fragariaefolia]|uniref:Unnamed protein product n=1 Tax=Phytophthora fragariaefolia TaxID=1490495 RepID=A0A9W7D423_9STRA|nr:unnamed protein product [Phytophthora fragariaefolia]
MQCTRVHAARSLDARDGFERRVGAADARGRLLVREFPAAAEGGEDYEEALRRRLLPRSAVHAHSSTAASAVKIPPRMPEQAAGAEVEVVGRFKPQLEQREPKHSLVQHNARHATATVVSGHKSAVSSLVQSAKGPQASSPRALRRAAYVPAVVVGHGPDHRLRESSGPAQSSKCDGVL